MQKEVMLKYVQVSCLCLSVCACLDLCLSMSVRMYVLQDSVFTSQLASQLLSCAYAYVHQQCTAVLIMSGFVHLISIVLLHLTHAVHISSRL